HTPGSVVVKLASNGERALFCGDVLHHAIQVHHPEWNSFVCADQDLARKSRRGVLEHCSGTGALLMPVHFGAPFVCHIEARGGGFVPRFVLGRTPCADWPGRPLSSPVRRAASGARSVGASSRKASPSRRSMSTPPGSSGCRASSARRR